MFQYSVKQSLPISICTSIFHAWKAHASQEILSAICFKHKKALNSVLSVGHCYKGTCQSTGAVRSGPHAGTVAINFWGLKHQSGQCILVPIGIYGSSRVHSYLPDDAETSRYLLALHENFQSSFSIMIFGHIK